MNCLRSPVKQTPTSYAYTYGSYRFPCKKPTCDDPEDKISLSLSFGVVQINSSLFQ